MEELELEVTFGTKTSCQINEEILFWKKTFDVFPSLKVKKELEELLDMVL